MIFICHFLVNYGDRVIIICSDTEPDNEASSTLDGNEVYYVDFDQKDTIKTLPHFANQITFQNVYELAQRDISTLKFSLDICKKGLKNPQESQGNIYNHKIYYM